MKEIPRVFAPAFQRVITVVFEAILQETQSTTPPWPAISLRGRLGSRTKAGRGEEVRMARGEHVGHRFRATYAANEDNRHVRDLFNGDRKCPIIRLGRRFSP